MVVLIRSPMTPRSRRAVVGSSGVARKSSSATPPWHSGSWRKHTTYIHQLLLRLLSDPTTSSASLKLDLCYTFYTILPHHNQSNIAQHGPQVLRRWQLQDVGVPMKKTQELYYDPRSNGNLGTAPSRPSRRLLTT